MNACSIIHIITTPKKKLFFFARNDINKRIQGNNTIPYRTLLSAYMLHSRTLEPVKKTSGNSISGINPLKYPRTRNIYKMVLTIKRDKYVRDGRIRYIITPKTPNVTVIIPFVQSTTDE